jgi:hypothetical protein
MNTHTNAEILVFGFGIVILLAVLLAIMYCCNYYNNRHNLSRRLFLLNKLRNRVVDRNWNHGVSGIPEKCAEFEIETHLPAYNLAHLLAEEFKTLGYKTFDFHCHLLEYPNGYSFQIELDNTDEEYVCDIISCGEKKWIVAL